MFTHASQTFINKINNKISAVILSVINFLKVIVKKLKKFVSELELKFYK